MVVAVEVAVPVSVAVAVLVGIAVPVDVSVGVGLGVLVPVGVGVGVTVEVSVGVGVGVSVGVAVTVSVSDNVCLKSELLKSPACAGLSSDISPRWAEEADPGKSKKINKITIPKVRTSTLAYTLECLLRPACGVSMNSQIIEDDFLIICC